MLSGIFKWFQIFSATKFPLRKQEHTKISLILLWQAVPSYPRGNLADQTKLRGQKFGDRQHQITKAATMPSLLNHPKGFLSFLHHEANAMSSNNNQTFWLWELQISQLSPDSGGHLRHLERKQAPSETLKTQIRHSTWFWVSQQNMTSTYLNTLENLFLKPTINYRSEACRLRRVRAWNTRNTPWAFCNRHLAALGQCMKGWFRAGEAAFNSAVLSMHIPAQRKLF